MKDYTDKVQEVRTALASAVDEMQEQDIVLGASFQLAVAMADLVRNDPGACVQTRDLAGEVLEAVEKALKKARSQGHSRKETHRVKKPAKTKAAV